MARRAALRRDRWLMAVFAMTAVVALVLAGWQVAVARIPPPGAYTELTVAAHRPGVVSVVVAGDTMLGEEGQTVMDTRGLTAVLAGVPTVFREADVAVVNLEGPATARTEWLDPLARYSYASPPEAIDALAGIGVNVFQLGNNHVMDRGAAGLADTVALAARRQVATVGAGANLAEAQRPLLVHVGDQTIGLVSFGENFGQAKRADEVGAGMVAFSAEAILAAQRVARQAGADQVIALVHWGDNYTDIVDLQRHWATELVAAGYDAIIGTGPHILQPVEMIGQVPVVYSLGNFVYGEGGRFGQFDQPGLGAVATLTFDQAGTTLALRCLSTDNAVVHFVARDCNTAESARAAGVLQGNLAWQGATATLRL
jgi:hypothetical protein